MRDLIYFGAMYLVYLAPLFFAVTIFRHKHQVTWKQVLLCVITTFSIWYLCNGLIKNVVMSPRPPAEEALFIPLDEYSFPSGHTTFVASLGFSLYAFIEAGYIPMLLLALVVGVFRVLAHVHHWYDIVGAFLISFLLTLVMYSFVKVFFPKVLRNR
jgi:membrane-associated phospholipid phosphatase